MHDTPADDVLTSPFGNFALHRWPLTANEKLRAWDAADEYLLAHVAEHVDTPGKVLVINDGHGALVTALHTWDPVSWGDSAISFRAAAENFKHNQLEAPLTTVASTDTPDGMFDLVLVKIPKTTALLHDQLAKLRRLVHAETMIVAAGMVKHIQKSAFAAFEQTIGPVHTSLAVKKARLLFAQFNTDLVVSPPPESITYHDPDLRFPLENLPNVFSQDRLDHGARFFIAQFHKLPEAHQVIDLGCGNGVLGLCLRKSNADVNVTFIDESYSAVASAQRNYQRLFEPSQSQNTEAGFVVAGGLDDQESESADLILCNPPFHQQHVVGQQMALSLFTQSKRVLRQGAELWIVANRHLNYDVSLKRLFGNCTTIATNNKFRVLKAVKR